MLVPYLLKASAIGQGGIASLGPYFDFLTQQEQTVASIVRAILKQLLGRGGTPEYLREAFQEGKRKLGVKELRILDLMGILRNTIASAPQVLICINALDECLPNHLPDYLASLGNILRESPGTRVFLTGGPFLRKIFKVISPWRLWRVLMWMA